MTPPEKSGYLLPFILFYQTGTAKDSNPVGAIEELKSLGINNVGNIVYVTRQLYHGATL